jgi:hypothetical protein
LRASYLEDIAASAIIASQPTMTATVIAPIAILAFCSGVQERIAHRLKAFLR